MAPKKTDEENETETKLMRFSCIPQLGKHGGGVQWDKEKKCVLASFDKNGEFETDDEYVIEKLRSLGYKTVEEHEVDERQERESQRRIDNQRAAKPAGVENFVDVKARFQTKK